MVDLGVDIPTAVGAVTVLMRELWAGMKGRLEKNKHGGGPLPKNIPLTVLHKRAEDNLRSAVTAFYGEELERAEEQILDTINYSIFIYERIKRERWKDVER